VAPPGVDDVRLSARKGVLRVLGKGQRLREVPIHPQLRVALAEWLQERRDWTGAAESSALFLNRRGSRLSARGAHEVITSIAAKAGLDDRVTAHVLRHSFATTLVRGGTDLVIAAELLGHARLEIPWHAASSEPSDDIAGEDIAVDEPTPLERKSADALGTLLRGSTARIPSRDLSRTVRARFEALRADGILDRRYRVYRASHIGALQQLSR
jgi:Phage integrase family